MSVKTIFKVLIGTLILMLISSAVVELFNISTTGLQINQISKMAGNQACNLFAQESYKKYSSGGAIDSADIVNANGTFYITGKFYPEDTSSPTFAKNVYEDIYTNKKNSYFTTWLSSNPAAIQGGWYNLKLINQGLNNPASLNAKFGDTGYNDAMLAKLYVQTMMTPVNLGIPYLDKDTLNKMFKWNLAQLLSNCNPKSIPVDESGKSYIAFKGFRIYADQAQITNIEYKTFDTDVPAQAAELEKLTNIKSSDLGFADDNQLEINTGIKEDRRKICVAGVSYTVPMSYEGITPIKQLFTFLWNNEVDGLKGSNGTIGKTYNDTPIEYESGGLNGNVAAAGVLPIPNRLIYYIIH